MPMIEFLTKYSNDANPQHLIVAKHTDEGYSGFSGRSKSRYTVLVSLYTQQ